MLCHDIHSYLAQVQIRADTCCSGNACSFQHVPYHGHSKLTSRHAVGAEIGRSVDKHLVHGVDMDILLSHIFQVYLIYFRAVGDIQRHSRRSHDIVQLQRPVSFKLLGTARLSAEAPVWSSEPSGGIDVRHLRYHLKKPRTSANSAGFQRRSHRKADSLFGAALVSDHKIGVKGIQLPFHALHRSIE